MKKLVLMMTLMASSLLLQTGCITFSGGHVQVSTPSPYTLGRSATIVYLLKKDDIKPEHQQAIKEVYLAVDKVATVLTSKDAKNFDTFIKAKIAEKIHDEKIVIIINEFITFYWDKLTEKIDFDKLTENEAVAVILEFHKGVQSALVDYKNLLE